MNRRLSARFWVEAALGVLTAVLALGALLWPDWIEIVFRVEPDGGSGSAEWTIVGLLALASTLSTSLATVE